MSIIDFEHYRTRVEQGTLETRLPGACRQLQGEAGISVERASMQAPSEAGTIMTQCSALTTTSIRSMRTRPPIKPGALSPPRLHFAGTLPGPPASVRAASGALPILGILLVPLQAACNVMGSAN